MTSPYATGVVGTYAISGDPLIDPLVWFGYKWGSDGAGTPVTLTYSFPKRGAKWLSNYYDQEPFHGFQPLTDAQQSAAKQALALWSEVANVKFKQVTETATNVGDIRFGNSAAVPDPDWVAWAYTPYKEPGFEWPENGDVWFDKSYGPNHQLKPGQEGFGTMLHEIGHALGLTHPFQEGGLGEPALDPQFDSDRYTVMSYTYDTSTRAYASTPQVLDILAIQYIYGANMTTRTGNNTYKFSASAQVNRSIWDAGGIDTIDLSNQRTNSFITLLEGQYSEFCRHGPSGTSSLLGIAYGVKIENAIGGSGADQIIGNAAANRLTGGDGTDDLSGNDGNDTLDGGNGDDALWGGDGDDVLIAGAGGNNLHGGDGNDLYVLQTAINAIVEQGSDSSDTVRSSLILGKIGGIENYLYTGALAWSLTADNADNLLSGGTGADKLEGAGGNDTLLGNGGNDVLIGGTGDDWVDGGAGNDKMSGGVGNDTYLVNAAGDSIDEELNADSDDTVKSSISVSLLSIGAGAIEHAVLLGTAAINATGNDQANDLTGNSGANRLNGGIGADTMAGANGSDTYAVDDLGDLVIEAAGGKAGGVDQVMSSVDFTLGANLEKLTLTGLADTKAIGNNLNNALSGNGGANTLNGAAGNDIMTGGGGDDVYIVDANGDVVNESAGGGLDTVESAISFSLAKRVHVENLTLTGPLNINGAGNALANTIIGNDGNNVLNGGAGADFLKGGAGNDTYIIDSLADVVDEDVNTDNGDHITTSAVIAAAYVGVENYTYTGTKSWNFTGNSLDNRITSGSAKDALIGGDGNDVLLSNSGNDLLNGDRGDDWLDGGAGNDTMKGGEGNDTYIINATGDIIEESHGDADDAVRTVFSVNLATLADGAMEHAMLLGTAAINATGNDANNVLIGNSSANRLNGGLGADTMVGGKGSDVYYVNVLGDEVVETVSGAAGGIDTVVTETSFYQLGANVENLTLLVNYASEAWGNALNNRIVGSSGNNKLIGGGGADTMIGGDGSDEYFVDSTTDIIKETNANTAVGGYDAVTSFISYNLENAGYVERLRLGGADSINGSGNALNNDLFGNLANNKLNGGAGNDVIDGAGGADTMTGGSGRDTFVYLSDAGSGDVITDFKMGASGDILDLSGLIDFGVEDPFSDGWLSFEQSGANTKVWYDDHIGADGFALLTTLLNAHLTVADTANYMT